MPDNEADAGTGPLQQVTGTGRVEAFSDGVFAIVVTLLVLDLKEPEHAPGELLQALVKQWPAYLGYFASFLYVAVIWLNHHQAFIAIRRVDRGVHLANLTLLFTTALIPFPTAVSRRHSWAESQHRRASGGSAIRGHRNRDVRKLAMALRPGSSPPQPPRRNGNRPGSVWRQPDPRGDRDRRLPDSRGDRRAVATCGGAGRFRCDASVLRAYHRTNKAYW